MFLILQCQDCSSSSTYFTKAGASASVVSSVNCFLKLSCNEKKLFPCCSLSYDEGILLYSCSAFNAHALGALADVAGPGLDSHLGTVLPPLIEAMGNDDQVGFLEFSWCLNWL